MSESRRQTASPSGAFTGTVVLAFAALRRDRVRTPAWAIGLALLFLLTASAWDSLYPTAAERVGLAATLGTSPALTALLGPLFAPLSTGGLTAWRLGAGITLVLGLANVFLVVRHSRAEEQDGRAELVLSGRVGRCAPLAAALKAAAALDALVFVLVVLLLGPKVGWSGSIALAAAVSVTALVFAAVAALTAQVARTSRGANSLASLVAAVTFVMAAAANSASDPGGPLLWLSPFGWVEQTRAFADTRWWLIGVSALVAVAISLLALSIAARRDLASGLLATRHGRRAAPAWVRSTWTMAWRLDRSAIVAWVGGAAAFGVLIGLLVRTAIDLVSSSPQLGDAIGRLGGTDQIADAYVLVMATILALIAASFGVTTVLRLHADEVSGRAELALSTPMSRTTWAGGRLVTAGVGSLLVMVIGGTFIGATYGAGSHDVAGQAARYGAAALLAVPAMWVLVAFTMTVVGLLPRHTWIAWVALIWTGVVAELGAALQLPQWLQRTTPFWYTPGWPARDFDVVPVLGLLLVVIALAGAGLVALRRRDLPV